MNLEPDSPENVLKDPRMVRWRRAGSVPGAAVEVTHQTQAALTTVKLIRE